MQEITDSAAINKMVQNKQALEVRLAYELLEVFNDESMGLIQKLREMVQASIREMEEVATNDLYRQLFHSKWNSAWKNYAVCTDNNIINWHAGTILFRSKKFIAQHCADWIRIFGEVMEDVVKGDPDMLRKSYQTGDSYHWTKFKGGYKDHPLLASDDLAQTGAGRRRVTDKDISTVSQSGGSIPSMGDYKARQTPVWGFMATITPFAGANKWRVMERDTTGKMDQVFGLMPGATISGTTTDNIFFIKRFAAPRLDPIFYLLPIATIVSGGHHSLLEVGLPLTMNGVNDYKVGLYSTLFSKGSGTVGVPAGVGEIKSILEFTEKHHDNNLMLLYYDGSTPTGCLLYDGTLDKQRWKNMVFGEQIMTIFKAMMPWPNKSKVSELATKLSIA